MKESEENFSREERVPEHEKPPVLYHASFRRDIDEFEPRREKVRNPDEGPVIFASPNLADVTRFMVPTDDSWTQISSFDNIQTIIISDEERFRTADKGGAIYSLPPDNFNVDDAENHPNEWTSKKTIKPSDKVEFNSALAAMLDQGVQVYFVDQNTLTQIQTAPDHGLSILRSLKSENEKLGKNFISLQETEGNE